MNCHSQIFANSPFLEPVRESFRTGRSIQWTRVHDLPDFVYFNHSIHVHKGVGCTTCHGQVDRMPLMWQESSLQMEWCLDCHRNPERYVRPRESVFSVRYQPPPNQIELGTRLVGGVSDSEAHELFDVPPMTGHHGRDSGFGIRDLTNESSRTGSSKTTASEASNPESQIPNPGSRQAAFWRTLEERAGDPAFPGAALQRVPVRSRSDHRSGRRAARS